MIMPLRFYTLLTLGFGGLVLLALLVLFRSHAAATKPDDLAQVLLAYWKSNSARAPMGVLLTTPPAPAF